MLGKRFTAQDLAELGIVNYAVPGAELDAKVDEIVQALLRRSSFALAWTKRIDEHLHSSAADQPVVPAVVMSCRRPSLLP